MVPELSTVEIYCCPTAAKAHDMDIGNFLFLWDLQEN
jgi:hypothetical protein